MLVLRQVRHNVKNFKTRKDIGKFKEKTVSDIVDKTILDMRCTKSELVY